MNIYKVLFCFLFILLTGIFAHAGTIKTFSDQALIIAIDNLDDGNRIIKSCNQKGCTWFPSKNASLYGFYGSDQDWADLFNQCGNYENLNELTDYTNIVTSLALFWQLGGKVSALKSVKNVIKSFSVKKQVFVKSTVEIGSSVLAATVWDYSNSINNYESAYPDIPSEYLIQSMNIINTLLDPHSGKFYVKEEFVLALNALLTLCTKNFVQEKITENVGKCIRGCHSENNERDNNNTQLPFQVDDFNGAIDLNSNQESTEINLDEIKDYLESF